MREFVQWLGATPISLAISQTSWVIPFVQTIHILGIAVILSSVLMIDLRVLGYAGRSQTLRQTLNRFGPWFWGALIALALTGAIMIIAEPIRQLMSISFWCKMAVLAIGVTVAAGFINSLNRNEAYWQESAAVRTRTKALGVATMLVWCAVLFLGRFIAYDPQIWGRLSPLF